ncbi:hypothetical protein WICMUC_005878 [Wickerhamomyces mucosus]|uniref:Guanosine-diphosphatase n=1 Tax=Wickerhamomyces mucosus TaxID=1378264 RepID=A0A9P8P2M0_9ASCO|nr:hypothetical protein WICMUC_005878 [Wickerhamomyces mucosus]
MSVNISPTLRNSRFIVAALVIFTIVIFLVTQPNHVNSISENVKSSLTNNDPVYPPNPNSDKETIGNSPQYADDSTISNSQQSNSQKSNQQQQQQQQSSNQDFKPTNDKEQLNHPKKVDSDTPIKEAPKALADKATNNNKQGGGFTAIKDSDKAYAGVPDSNSDSDSSSSSSSSSKGKSSGKSGSSSGECTKTPEYVIMIDAGSTGSRIHIYEFDVCYSPPRLNNEIFEMLKPGLSSFDTDAIGAAQSLNPLLTKALESIPDNKKSCTPVAVKATAGLRLLGEEKSNKILKAVRDHLETNYPFAVVDGDGVSIMSGDDEGVYAWITANYLLGNIGSSEKIPTAAVFDLGGGSTQIVFEPEFKNGEKLIDGEHKYQIDFGNRDFTLYQFSHLGYGLMAGRNKINSLILENAIKEGKVSKGQEKISLISPCIATGEIAKDVKVKLDNGETYVVDFQSSESSTGAQCRYLAEAILKKDSECTKKPCSFNGVHQPSLVKTFKDSSDLYIFSYFYDRTQPLGMPSSFTLQELTELAKVVCNGETTWINSLSAIDGSIKELKDEPQWCLDLSFQVALLHTGYDIPLNRELKTAQTIAGNELGWCLGASLPLLDGNNWKCRVKEVSA